MFRSGDLTEEQGVTAMEIIGDSDTPGLFRDGELIAVFTIYDYDLAEEIVNRLNGQVSKP